MIIWLLFVGVMMTGSVNLQICAAWAGPMKYTSSIVAAVMFTVFAVFVSVFPVLACTEGGIKDIIKMAFETILLLRKMKTRRPTHRKTPASALSWS